VGAVSESAAAASPVGAAAAGASSEGGAGASAAAGVAGADDEFCFSLFLSHEQQKSFFVFCLSFVVSFIPFVNKNKTNKSRVFRAFACLLCRFCLRLLPLDPRDEPRADLPGTRVPEPRPLPRRPREPYPLAQAARVR